MYICTNTCMPSLYTIFVYHPCIPSSYTVRPCIPSLYTILVYHPCIPSTYFCLQVTLVQTSEMTLSREQIKQLFSAATPKTLTGNANTGGYFSHSAVTSTYIRTCLCYNLAVIFK